MLTEEALRQAVNAFGLTEHAERLDDRERDASLGLLVMVVGAGNFGKSSLINALCGRPIAPVSVIPKTFKIDVFTAGEAGTALVRHVGEARPVAYSQGDAKQIEAERESQFKDKSQTQLAEIVWRYDDLCLPPGISIVDTPGISQALGKSAKGVSLASVLGSTFEVDEVWARWFHRADVVIWAFCANKMEDSDTRSALESALNLFDKPIIPVATKADLIPSERWTEVTEHFNAIYGGLLRDRQSEDLHLTVCGGKNPKILGAGIPELRSSLERIATEALAVKRHTETAFIRDESSAVAKVLDETSKMLVSNLREIAALGDTLAEQAVKEAQRGRQQALHRVNAFLNGIRRDPKLAEIAKAVNELTSGGRSGDIELEVRNRLLVLIDGKTIEREVNEAFALSAQLLEATAERLSQSTEIAKLSFKSSGTMARHAVPLKLKLKAFSVTSKLDFSTNLKNPSGFFGNAWDVIKRLLGIDRFSIDDIHFAMVSALVVSDADLEPAMLQALHKGFAPALRDAVESALLRHLEATDSEALALLRDADIFLSQLVSADASPAVTTYGPQAEYWANLIPEVKTLLSLAREELTRLLPEFKVLLLEPFPFEAPHQFPPFGPQWRNRRVDSQAMLVEVEMREVARQARRQERVVEVNREVSFLPYLIETQKRALEESPVVEALDGNLAEAVVGVRYQSAGSHLAQAGSEAFQTAMADSPRRWVHGQSFEMFGKWYLGKGTLLGSGLGIVGGFGLLFVRGELWPLFLAFAGAWFAIGLARPFAYSALRYQTGIGQALTEEVSNCQSDAAALISLKTVDQVIEGMTAELAPRPLQKLLLDSGLLEIGPHPLREDDLQRLRELRRPIPSNFVFDRDEVNER